jgi:hypothetical protein
MESRGSIPAIVFGTQKKKEFIIVPQTIKLTFIAK